jgi:hypothetical protein
MSGSGNRASGLMLAKPAAFPSDRWGDVGRTCRCCARVVDRRALENEVGHPLDATPLRTVIVRKRAARAR